MKKTAKSTNTTSRKKRTPIGKDKLTPIQILNKWRQYPVSEATIEQIAEELIEWLQNPKSIRITQFTADRYMTYDTFMRFTERNENLKEAYKYAKEVFANRREAMAVYKDNNCNPSTIHFTLGRYCPIWREEQEAVSERRVKEKDNITGDFNVTMEPFANSDSVPDKDKND